MQIGEEFREVIILPEREPVPEKVDIPRELPKSVPEYEEQEV